MNKWKFEQFLESYREYQELISEIDFEIQELYEDVSPALTYLTGDRIVKYSIPLEDQVFKIIDRKVVLNFRRERIEGQYTVMKGFLETLNEEDRGILTGAASFDRRRFRRMLGSYLGSDYKKKENVVVTRNNVEDDLYAFSADEYDKLVDEMSMKELLEGFYDKDDSMDAFILKRRLAEESIFGRKGRKPSAKGGEKKL